MHRFERWKPLLDTAHTAEAVVRVMTDYASLFDAADRAALPECCRDLEFKGPEGLVELSFVLTREELMYSGPERSAYLLRQMAMTFSAAARRLVEIGKPWLTEAPAAG